MAARKTTKERPIIFTDDGWVMSHEPPLTPEIIREKMVGAFADTPASLWWSVGDHEVYAYETQVGEIIGEGYELSELPDDYRTVVTNLRHLMDTAGGPLSVLVDSCREAGLEFFPRVRMNSHYAKDPSAPEYGRYRIDHPELLIGRPGEEIPEGSIDWDVRTGLDYTFPEVRDYMYSIITELFERFDVDGLEMDFNRHPTFFRREEGFQNRYLMTDLIGRVRTRMREVEAERGRPLELAVRVPPTLADSRRIGLDVAEWISEGLVDIVTAGIGWIPFEMPIREFVEAAEGTGVQVYGCIEALRPTVDDNALRAAAFRYHQAGAGVYLYNFFNMPAEWNRRMLNQLSDPRAMARLNKRYELDHTDRIAYPGHGGAFRNAVPAVQLPVALHQTLTGRGPVLRLEIADDLEEARRDGALDRCVLGLLLDGFSPLDELDVRVNNEALPWSTSRTAFTGGGAAWPHLEGRRSIQYDLDCPPLQQGVNEVEVRLASYGPRPAAPAVLIGLEVSVSYGDG